MFPKKWIVLGVLLLLLAFQAGYVLGRHELSPIIIEKNRSEPTNVSESTNVRIR